MRKIHLYILSALLVFSSTAFAGDWKYLDTLSNMSTKVFYKIKGNYVSLAVENKAPYCIRMDKIKAVYTCRNGKESEQTHYMRGKLEPYGFQKNQTAMSPCKGSEVSEIQIASYQISECR